MLSENAEILPNSLQAKPSKCLALFISRNQGRLKLWLKPWSEPFHLCLSSFSLPFPAEPDVNRLHMLLTEPPFLPKVNTAKTPCLSACLPSSWLGFHVIWSTLAWNREGCSAALWKMWNIRHTMYFSNLDSVTETWLVCCLADKDGWGMEDFALLSVQQNLSIDLKRDVANERGDETGQSFVFCLFAIFANVGVAWTSRWTRSWIRRGGRRRVTRCQAPSRSRPREEYWLHSVCGREICLWWLSPWRGKGLLSWKMTLSVLSRPTVFRHSQMLFVQKRNPCFWPFKMGSIVQSIFISLWCVCFASAETRCHICHVCSGFYSLLLITLYRPMREPASISINWQAHVLFSLPECTGLFSPDNFSFA